MPFLAAFALPSCFLVVVETSAATVFSLSRGYAKIGEKLGREKKNLTRSRKREHSRKREARLYNGLKTWLITDQKVDAARPEAGDSALPNYSK
ncbi:hypothetical protein [Paraburkholderia azotifigens]|uniref:Uncharacterized protein n=1 Tax=Paraburkholderia azotifigens TaxID=2057004 RepID=A0A5C6V5R1_9BURK|nr:hypothetical protein [Paraburkholderia azotifigens]TXC80593.1 hypothetical protein FRZ40_40765 [Paraburkholderia azotifigens]